MLLRVCNYLVQQKTRIPVEIKDLISFQEGDDRVFIRIVVMMVCRIFVV